MDVQNYIDKVTAGIIAAANTVATIGINEFSEINLLGSVGLFSISIAVAYNIVQDGKLKRAKAKQIEINLPSNANTSNNNEADNNGQAKSN